MGRLGRVAATEWTAAIGRRGAAHRGGVDDGEADVGPVPSAVAGHVAEGVVLLQGRDGRTPSGGGRLAMRSRPTVCGWMPERTWNQFIV